VAANPEKLGDGDGLGI